MFRKMLLASILLVVSQIARPEVVAPAREPVEKLNAALIDVMKNAGRLGYQGRYKKLEPVIKDVFQFETVAQIALGAHWKKLDQNKQREFIAKLSELSVATYASQFDAYKGQAFRYESTEEVKPDRVIVRYTMTVPNDKPISFDYVVNQYGGRWRIINIIADGISDLALKKAQYTSIIDREGFDSLLAKLTQKIADYAKKAK